MAALTDFGGIDLSQGVYGLYNDFLMRITRTGSSVFKLKFRVRVTAANAEGLVEVVKDVTPINDIGIVNPIELMKDEYFKCQTIGSEFGYSLDDSEEIDVAALGFNLLRIEVGEVSAASASLPPVFGGYDTSDDVWIYNGYENISRSSTDVSYSNYLEIGWYSPVLVKLPHTIKSRKVACSPGGLVDTPDFNKIYAINKFKNDQGHDLTIKNKYVVTYDSDGGSSTITEDVSNAFSIDGYWTFFGVVSKDSSDSKIEVYFDYENEDEALLFESERITYYDCEYSKNDRYRLRWFNRYGAMEYMNFKGKFTETDNTTSGKTILSNGIDYSSTSFGGIKPLAQAQKRLYGRSTRTEYTLVSDFINSEERDSLRELVKSPNILMFNPDNTVVNVIPRTNSFRIEDEKDGLLKVSIRLELADKGKIQIR